MPPVVAMVRLGRRSTMPCLVLTHHPLGWLSPRSRKAFLGEIAILAASPRTCSAMHEQRWSR